LGTTSSKYVAGVHEVAHPVLDDQALPPPRRDLRHVSETGDRVVPEGPPVEARRDANLRGWAPGVDFRARDHLDFLRHVGADAARVAAHLGDELGTQVEASHMLIRGRFVGGERLLYDQDDGRQPELQSTQLLLNLLDALQVLVEIQIDVDLQLDGVEACGIHLVQRLHVAVERVGESIPRDGIERCAANLYPRAPPRCPSRTGWRCYH
jgi:hypothetical protein